MEAKVKINAIYGAFGAKTFQLIFDIIRDVIRVTEFCRHIIDTNKSSHYHTILRHLWCIRGENIPVIQHLHGIQHYWYCVPGQRPGEPFAELSHLHSDIEV